MKLLYRNALLATPDANGEVVLRPRNARTAVQSERDALGA